MTPDDPTSPLGGWMSRAGKLIRELPDPGWDAIADSIVDAVRVSTRSGWPLTVHADVAASEVVGAITVSDLVLRGAVARALRFDEIAVASVVEIFAEDGELDHMRIELTGRYGTELRDIVETARERAASVVEEFLGITMPKHGIDIAVTDIVDGNPVTTERAPDTPEHD